MKYFLFVWCCIVPLLAMARQVVVDTAAAPLNGPWKFATGDDLRRADPGFDDAGWEQVDLTPPPGAHDGDVGLSGYVPGWCARGHAGYHGYAWYRLKVNVAAGIGDTLLLAAPASVDDAYQLFVNGQSFGGNARFNGTRPVVYSIRPRVFRLPLASAAVTPEGNRTLVLAFRVWMDAGSLSGGNDVGGIHIAPVTGTAKTLLPHYRMQWRQTILGYIVDVIEPLIFIVLAFMAYRHARASRQSRFYRWLMCALVLTALVRVNQATYSWWQFESIQVYDLARNFLLVPLVLGAWTITWYHGLRSAQPAKPPVLIAVLTVLLLCAQLLHLQYVHLVPPAINKVATIVSSYLRLLLIACLLLIAINALRHKHRDRWLILPAMLLVSIGLFADELSSLGVQGIWFPFGVGVSRTQFAYAVLEGYLLVWLLRRGGLGSGIPVNSE
ncbi:glycoside hydrolase [Deminuibacter soli]|uniref:Glycoside hydrolase n=1 Tax=Deminuibacter soli TaxID=2291815 RepID=A0A3E1NEJ9_9BACT|nr:glycoside hydrolase [Deminuibacter soli]RFM26406.1 glycoside hydrolase [Deminuibacter soli]